MPTNYPKIQLNDERICNYCLEQHRRDTDDKEKQASQSKKIKLKQDFENFIKNCKGKSNYDCLLLFSGGKDSSYLLYLLTKQYGLNVLAVTIDTGLENLTSKQNVKKLIEHLNVDHIFFTPKNDFFKKLYRYFLTNPNNKTYCGTICGLCQMTMHSIALKIATEKKIPFIALGYSPDQAHFYEIPKEEISHSWVPKELFHEPFNEIDRSFYWDPLKVKTEYIPRFILPFYVIEYPGVEKIIEKLSELGFGEKRRFNPNKTNCYLLYLLMYLDMNKYGYNPFLALTCDLIRKRKLSRRKMWLILTVGLWLLKFGIIKRRAMKYAINHLGFKKNDILALQSK